MGVLCEHDARRKMAVIKNSHFGFILSASQLSQFHWIAYALADSRLSLHVKAACNGFTAWSAQKSGLGRWRTRLC